MQRAIEVEPAPNTQHLEYGHDSPVAATSMRAIFHARYGSLDLLRVRSVARPTPGADEVLVKVRAAGLHIGDLFGVRGTPFAMRFETGLLKPKTGVPGFDVAGTVVAVGDNVTRFKPGDDVFGECHGSCAEYVRVSSKRLAPKPSSLSFQEAAAVPTSALAALHALRDVAKLEAGMKLLINGASGGVGTFAVQIAKSMGAEVTGVCSTANVELVRGLGADQVIDYTQDDFTLGKARYDVIFDNVENRTLSECRRVLTESGTLILNSGTGASGLALLLRLVKPLLLSPFVRHKLRRYLSVPNTDDLQALADLIESGCLRPVVDRTYALDEVPAALGYLETGRARGKVVVALA